MSKTRLGKIQRKTGETDIVVQLAVDGGGQSKIATGIPFFDHMLTLFAKHALFDLEVRAKGDLQVDFHHTVEDTGIVIGQALIKALATRRGSCATGIFTCRWTRRWCAWRSISAGVRSSSGARRRGR